MVKKFEIGFIGLGKMGANMVTRMLSSKTVTPIIWDLTTQPIKKLQKKGAKAAKSIPDLISKCKQKRKVIWLMLPAGSPTQTTFELLLKHLKKGDIIIDGANSNFHDTLQRHKTANKKGIEMLDVGVSGGIIAAKKGYPMMIGGKQTTYNYCKPLFKSFGTDKGYTLVGPQGAGHYVKMIHNSIEYGMMQAIGEGFELLEKGRIKNLDLEKIAGIWNHSSIVSSFLMQMTHQALKKDKKLKKIKPYIDDNGEGKWAIIEALEYQIPFTSNTHALNARYTSRDKDSTSHKLIAAMRHEFGGHPIQKK